MWRLIALALFAIPFSVGIGFVVEAMFPFMSPRASVVVTVAVTVIIMTMGRD